LTTRVTPKIKDNPAATKKSDDAEANPFKSWEMRAENSTLVPN